MLRRFTKLIKNLFESTEAKIKNFSDNKLAKKDTRKITTPQGARSIVTIAAVCLLLSYGVILLTESSEVVGSGINKLEEESKVKFGISEMARVARVEIGDPLEELTADRVEVTEEDICADLLAKVKEGTKLNSYQKPLFDDCMNSGNYSDLSADERKILKMLSDPKNVLSDLEKQALLNALNGDEDAMKLAQALLSDDPNVRKAAQMILNNPNMSDELKQALLDVISGKITDPDLINALLSDDPDLVKQALEYLKEENPESKKNILDKIKNRLKQKRGDIKDPGEIDKLTNKEKIELVQKIKDRIKERALEIAKKEEELKDLKKKLRDMGIFDKIANDEPLNAEEQIIYDEFLKTSSDLRKLKNEQTKDLILYKELISQIKDNLGKLGFTGISSDGFYEEMSGLMDSGKSLTDKQIDDFNQRNKSPQKIVDDNGDEVEIALYKFIQDKLKAAHNEDNFEDSLIDNLSPLALKDSKVKIDGLNVWSRNLLDGFGLPLDLRIPVSLETSIYVSSKAPNGKRVVFRFLDNVMNPENDEVLIPIGSKIVGKTGEFDENTKLISIVDLNVVGVGGEKIEIAFDVMTANGYTGIPGGVKSTRKEKITAAVLAQFASSMTEYFSLVVEDQVLANDNLDPTAAIAAGGLNGAARGIDRLSEMLVQDFQNAQSIFYAPKGMKLILTPK